MPPMPDEKPLGEELDWTPVERPAAGADARIPRARAPRWMRPTTPVRCTTSRISPDGDPAIWTYLPDGPYESAEHLREMLAWAETSEDPLYFTLAGLPGERPWASRRTCASRPSSA